MFHTQFLLVILTTILASTKLITLLKNYSELDLEAKLFELELKIEKGEVFEAMNEYPLLLQDNLQDECLSFVLV